MTTRQEAEEMAEMKFKMRAEKKAEMKIGKNPVKKVKKPGGTPRRPVVFSATTDTGTDTGPDTGLIVWSADQAAADPLVQALKAVRALDLPAALPGPEAVQPGAQAPEILLLCAAPLVFLCQQMAQGTPPSVALEAWKAQAHAVLAVNRRNRRKVHILDIAQALRDRGSCLTRFGVVAAAAGTDAPDDASDAPDQVLLLLAQRCLNGDPQARALAGELAAAMAAGGAAIPDDPDAAFRSYREACWTREEVGLLRTQMSLMLEEMDLVQAQNSTAQQEMQSLSESAVLAEQRLVQLNQGIASYQAQLEELRATKVELSEKLAEQEIALKDAGDARRDLETQTAELVAIRERAEGFQAWAHQLENSQSYRLTAPLRWVRALLSRGRG